MHVLLVSQYFPPDPDSSRGLPFARWLRDRGHEVTVLTAAPHYYSGGASGPVPWRDCQILGGIRVIRVGLYRRHDRSALRRMLYYLSFAGSAALFGLPFLPRVDVVYVTSTPPTTAVPAWIYRKLHRVPYVVNVVDIWPEAVLDSGMISGGRAGQAAAAVIRWMCGVLYGGAAMVTTISDGYARILVEQGFAASERLKVFHNAAPEAALGPAVPEPDLKRQFGWQDRFVFLYAGNFGVFQGVDTILAAAKILEHNRRVGILLIGAGQCEPALRAQASELENVRFLPARQPESMPSLYASADCLLIHLNDREFLRATVPGKTQISLAVGRPIVIAARGESADLIARAQAGLVCAPQEPRQLVECMLRMAAAPVSERERMGRNGPAFYRQHMAIEVTAPALERLLLDCISARRRVE